MMKKLFSILFILAVFTSTASAQGWVNEGAFVDTSYNGGVHGVSVDPDGKVWTANYYTTEKYINGSDTIATSAILVFNADGTEASFSPIYTVTTGGVVDTLNGNCRGMGVDKDGNILYLQTGVSKILKIDYKTGLGLARAEIVDYVSHPTGPSVSSDGTIYVGNVLPGKPIAMFDNDLVYQGNAVDAVVGGYSRTLEVSSDGLSIYFFSFSNQKTYLYKRADEFSSYELTDSIFIGMSIESSAWNPSTGQLWVSNDTRGKDITKGDFTWYGYDSGTKTVVSALKWDENLNPAGGVYYARGMDFAPDGNTAYLGVFRQDGPHPTRLQKVTLNPVAVEKIDNVIPTGYELSQNYPNPFNPTTKINFSIPEAGIVTVKVYDILGQEVVELVNEVRVAGSYKVDFDASHLSSGMYIYKITANNFTATKKMMLLK